jgi:hypothetical protein
MLKICNDIITNALNDGILVFLVIILKIEINQKKIN